VQLQEKTMNYEEKLTGLQLEAFEEIASNYPDVFPASNREDFIKQMYGYLMAAERKVTVDGIEGYMRHVISVFDKCAERQRNLFGIQQ
jgi:hypothetical protein